MGTAQPSAQQLVQRQEILQLLQQLAASRTTLYCNTNEEDRFVAFQLQHVTDSALTLLPLGDYDLHQRLSANANLQLWTRYNNVRITFSVERMGRLDAPTQFVSLPASVSLCQQRSNSRVIPSYAEPLLCRFYDHEYNPISAQVIDISEGGLGMVESDFANELHWQKGQQFSDCQLELGKYGQLIVSLNLCYVEKRLSDRGMQQLHAGARFISPGPEVRHYITKYRQEIELSRQRHMWRQQLPV